MYIYLYRTIPNYHLSDKNLPLMQTDWMLLTEDLLRKTVMYKWLKTDNPSYWLIVTAPALFCPTESTIHLGNSSMLVSSTYISHQYLTCVWLRMLEFETKNRDTIVDIEINQNPAWICRSLWHLPVTHVVVNVFYETKKIQLHFLSFLITEMSWVVKLIICTGMASSIPHPTKMG